MKYIDVEELYKAKKEKHISFDKLAKITGLGRNTIIGVFRGYIEYPRHETIQAIYEALGIEHIRKKNYYETKFARNQEVWYINYVTSVYNCPHCGEECYEESIDGVKKGIVAYITIKDGDLSNCTEEMKITYTIIAETIKGKYLYTGRSEEDVFATEEEALKRVKELQQ